MKNMKFLFILLLACPQIKAAALENDFVLNCLISMKASKALQNLVDLQEKKSADKKEADKPAGPGSTFVSWFSPSKWMTPVDQSNPAIMKLKEIENQIQVYYNNSKWFNKSKNNANLQDEARTKIEQLVAEYRQKLDAKDTSFVAYKSTFEDMIKDAQGQISYLNVEEANEQLFKNFSDLLLQLNPFSSKSEAADVNNPASQLIQKMEDALAMYYDNTTNLIQKAYQSADVTKTKEQNKSAAIAQFKDLAAQYQTNKDNKDFAAKKDAFEALFAQAQEVFGYESSSDASQAPADSMFSQVSAYMSSFFPAQQKPATPADKKADKPAGAATEEESKAQDAQALLGEMEKSIKIIEDRQKSNKQMNSQLQDPKAKLNQAQAQAYPNRIKENQTEIDQNTARFANLLKQYIDENGLFFESQRSLSGAFDQQITSKDKKQPIANDSRLRTLLNSASAMLPDTKISLPITSTNGIREQYDFKTSLSDLSDMIKSSEELQE